MPYHFFPMIARMRYISRWGLMRNTDPENVQEHSHMVAVLAHALAVIENERFSGQTDPGVVAVAALYHDASEILTGAMPTPIQYDNPDVIMLRDGRSVDYERTEKTIAGKKIYESRFPARLGDVFVAMSDGVIHAGVGQSLNFGWERPNVVEYLEAHYNAAMSAKAVAGLVSDACRDLYMGKPGDDTTVAALRIRERQLVNLMIGPPVNPEDDEKIMRLFFGQGGKTIVCGGTTSTIVAKYLHTSVRTCLDYLDPEIPPIGFIEGVDLCTEGVLTMKHVVELARRYSSGTDTYSEWIGKKDGASLIAQMLFESATDVNLFVGRAMNPAHQNPDMPIDLSIKLRLIEDLAKYLELMGKTVKVSYY